MKTIRIYQCEDSVEGIFTAIYKAWESKYGHEYNQIQVYGETNYELFSEYIPVETDYELARRVADSINRKISAYAYQIVYSAAMSNDLEKGTLMYRFLVLGFHYGAKVTDYLSEPTVMRMFELDRMVGNEAMHFEQFIRFCELEHGILLGRIRPVNNVVSMVAPHFADRFPNENWVIYDETRKLAVIHPKYQDYYFVQTDGIKEEKLTAFSEEEAYFQKIWNIFVDNISIKQRENRKLQQNMMPLRFREFMPEFASENKKGRSYV